MGGLRQLYEISKYDEILCKIFAKIRGTHKIPKYIQKRSSKKYERKDNLARYFIHKYRNISVGEYTYGFKQFYGQENSIESIGSFCSIADNVNMTTGNHPMNCITTHPIVYLREFGMLEKDKPNLHFNKKVIIGNDVWIGRDVTILPGVKIGNGAVIGTGAVVNRDVPDYAVVVGVPAKVIKYRFTPEKIKKLNELKWWCWSDEKIRNNIELLIDPDTFFEKMDNI